MRMLRVFRQRARSLFRGARADAELDRELAFHLDQLTEENLASGMDPIEARRAARRALGNPAALEDQCRDQRRIGWLTDLRKDVAYAWRMLRKSPGFTAVGAATLALGVGGSIAVYALTEALLLRSLPYPSPERLVSISSVHVRRGESGIGQDDFRDWQASNSVFERMTFAEFSQVTLTGLGEPERVSGLSVSEGFFETLGVAPQFGRWFTPEERKPRSADRVVILSHRFWMRKFGGRPEAVGSVLVADGVPFRITGVMPETFRMNEGHVAEYWTPIRYINHGRQQHQYSCYARLKPGVSVRAAQAQMSDIARRIENQFTDNSGWGVRVTSLRASMLEEIGPALTIFAAAAAIVLLIACANIASLLLARGVGRSKEIAVRMALGAGRRRVLRLLLTESLLLAALGTIAGMALAWWLLRIAIAVAPPGMALGEIVSVSPTLAAFVIALALSTGVLTGVWPAFRGSRTDLQKDLKEGGASVVAGARSLSALVVVEIALAVTLLAFAGLLVESFRYLAHTDLGYRTDHLLTFRTTLPRSRYRDDRANAQFCDRLLPQLAALPGVVSVSASESVPLGDTYSGGGAEVEGDAVHRDWADASVRYASVTPDYFRTLAIPLRAGRVFERTDTAEAEPVVIVNEAFLRKLMPKVHDPLDARVRLGGGQWRRVVGVVADIHYSGPAGGVPAEAYTPFAQGPYLQYMALRTVGPEEAVVPAIRRVIGALDPSLAITQVRTMKQAVDTRMSLPRWMMVLVSSFAAIALGMSTLGLAGVMAYAVSRRKREIGLRMALGAARGDVARAVLRDAARLVIAGCSAGLLCALAGARVLESLLYGVRPRDPLAMAAAPAVLAVVALLATLAPARRAASVDPIVALRQE